MGTPNIDRSSNSNHLNSTYMFGNQLNNFLAKNSNNFVNGDRTFNQWTGKHTDSCEYKQRLNLATKPMEYYVNSLNNISGATKCDEPIESSGSSQKEGFGNQKLYNNNNPFLTFTPIGNTQVVNIANVYDRPIPSTLQKTSSIYTLPYSTSPFLGASNNVNNLDTDNDLVLKAGRHLRSKNNSAKDSEKQFAFDGDLIKEELASTVQRIDPLPTGLSDVINPNVPGLNVAYNYRINNNTLSDPSRTSVSSTVALRNYHTGPLLSCPEYKNIYQTINN